MNVPLFATIITLVPYMSQGQYCPMGTVRGVSPSDCYYYSANSATWLRAEENCILRGGHLASVSSTIVNSVVKDAARISCQDEYWLGGSWDQYEPNAWAWSDGRRFSFTNWAQGQPASGGDICLAMNVRSGLWYSEAGSQQKPYICKVPALGNVTATCPTISAPTVPTFTCPTPPPPTPAACPTPKPVCLDGWTYIPQAGKCYKVPSERGVTWLDCQSICRKVGGSLATIHSDNENYWIQEFQSHFFNSTWVAIGLFKRTDDASFSWVDGTPVNYVNWGSGYPSTNSGYNCVFSLSLYDHSAPSLQLQWVNNPCDTKMWGNTDNSALCEMTVSA